MSVNKKVLDIDVKLTKDNYAFWYFKIVPLLEDEGLIDAAATAEPNPDSNQPSHLVTNHPRTKRAILQNVSDDIGMLLMRFDSAPDMWKHLFQKYSGKNETRKLAGIKKLAQLK